MEKWTIENKPRRNFLESEGMQVGDYIDMPYQESLKFIEARKLPVASDDNGNNKKNNTFKEYQGLVRISIVEIKDDGKRIVIETGNKRKEIESSLFIKYRQPEIESPVKISDIKGNGEDRNQTILNRDRIKEIVEPALVKACEAFYDKNIKTLDSSANSSDIEHRGFAGIVIDYNSLSENNKKIVDEFFGGHRTSGDDIEVASIKIPIDINSTIPEVEEKFLEAVDKFEQQSLTWTKVFSFQKLIKDFNLSGKADGWTPEYLAEYSGLYFDKESDLFFYSKEHCEKVKNDKRLFDKMKEEAKE